MTYKEEWEDFIQRELITSSFKTEAELKECYDKSFETNKSVVEFLIGYELSNLLQADFTLMINKDSVVVNYSNSNPNKEIFAMPCNYYGCQIDYEYIYLPYEQVIEMQAQDDALEVKLITVNVKDNAFYDDNKL